MDLNSANGWRPHVPFYRRRREKSASKMRHDARRSVRLVVAFHRASGKRCAALAQGLRRASSAGNAQETDGAASENRCLPLFVHDSPVF
jgi:hypothetical protein